MSVVDEYLRISQMMSNLTMSWPLLRMDQAILDEIDSSARTDRFLKTCQQEILTHFGSVRYPEDRNGIAQAYTAYSEASVYVLLKKRGVEIGRTPETGGYMKKRPDFVHEHENGAIYFEVKCLDFEGGDRGHKAVAYNALEVAVDLETRSREPGIGEMVISTFAPGATAADRVETLIAKISNNIKREQLTYGPCVLVVDLGRLEPDAHHPSCLLPIYYNDGWHGASCASGELWHTAVGRLHEMLYCLPDFEGDSNIDRPLEKEGVLREHPELLGISFVIKRLCGKVDVYSIWNSGRTTQELEAEGQASENDVLEVIQKYSDALNDTENTWGYRYTRRC